MPGAWFFWKATSENYALSLIMTDGLAYRFITAISKFTNGARSLIFIRPIQRNPEVRYQVY